MPSQEVVADVTDAMIEKVRNKVQELFETSNTVSSLIEKGGEAETMSQKLYRIPLVTQRGGIFGKFDADGGDMGGGSGMKVIKVTAGYFPSKYTVELTKLAMDATATSEQSVVNAFKYSFTNAIKELQVYDDITFHTSGDAVVTSSVGASAASTWATGAKTTYTFADATDTVGVRRLRPGMAVDVYGTGGTPKRTTAGGASPFAIDHIDWKNKVVYLDGLVNSAAATDILAFTGMAATLTAFADWPTTLTNDTFRHGLYYAMDNGTSHYFLGMLKSANTELLPNWVNASTAAITFSHGQALLDQIILRRDEEVMSGMVGLASMAQRAAIFNIGIAVSNKYITGATQGESVDLMPSNNRYSNRFEFCGVPMVVDKRQDNARIDFIVPKLWGRAMLHDTKFHEVQGRTVFESRIVSGTSANLKAAVHFHIVQMFDWYSTDNGAQGYIYNLTSSSLY